MTVDEFSRRLDGLVAKHLKSDLYQLQADSWSRDGQVARQWMDGFVRSLLDDSKDLAAQRRMDEVEL